MPFIAHRQVKGKTYRYLTQSYRDDLGKPRQKTIRYLGSAPGLSKDALIAIVLFAGGGGVECGLVQAGIRPIISVEFDPSNPELSNTIASNNHLNFRPYNGKVIRQSVEELARNRFLGFPINPDFLHASPVCSHFTRMNDGKETQEDINAAIAVSQAILYLQPRSFTLENVPAYENSESWYIIEQTLKEEGYLIASGILDAADYGVPQSRKRFIVKASRGSIPGLPQKQQRVGWFDAIASLIPQLPSSELLPAQHKALNEKLSVKPGLEALLIERIGFRDKPQVREPAEPCWTIKKSIFHDHKGANRSRFIDVWLAAGEVKALNIDVIAILQGFPQWYCLPSKVRVAGSILGYSVPPPLIKALVST
jgi:DNA (cytosine-5)-methyltransferase 1